MDDLMSRAERLRASVSRLGAAATRANGPLAAATAERAGVTVRVDRSGTVQGVEVAPGWQHEVPPPRLGEHVREVLDEAWALQLGELVDPRTAPDAYAAASPRPAGDPLDVLHELSERLAHVDVATDPSEPDVPALRASTAHVTGRHDGRITLEVDPGWLGDATSAEISAELTEVLGELTRSHHGPAWGEDA
ncbi:hypothetical protein [Nocardioides hwasunensis]|uniref:YbaB/EbfC family DNA-binding protein n=1 Tax=Nocardioides hwasunensis TaxID=397258 RepID=A0ABR8MP83_9ACTN|nr:hypothetical protein [Nocardioides hwasunensis]MBD3916334.1 hypothetical protein [Nocardioides hwasunensis]